MPTTRDFGNGTFSVDFKSSVSKNYNVVLNCTAGILPGFPFNFVVLPGIFRLFSLSLFFLIILL